MIAGPGRIGSDPCFGKTVIGILIGKDENGIAVKSRSSAGGKGFRQVYGGKTSPGKSAGADVGDRIRQTEHARQKTQSLKGICADPSDGNAVDFGGNGQGHAFRAGLRQGFQISLCKSGDGPPGKLETGSGRIRRRGRIAFRFAFLRRGRRSLRHGFRLRRSLIFRNKAAGNGGNLTGGVNGRTAPKKQETGRGQQKKGRKTTAFLEKNG